MLRLDGAYFGAPNAWTGILHYDNRADHPYYEVQYVQTDERPQRIHSAFLPLLSVQEAGPDFATLAASSPVGSVGASDGNAGKALAALTLLGLAYTVWQSGLLDQWHQEISACRAQQSLYPGHHILC